MEAIASVCQSTVHHQDMEENNPLLAGAFSSLARFLRERRHVSSDEACGSALYVIGRICRQWAVPLRDVQASGVMGCIVELLGEDVANELKQRASIAISSMCGRSPELIDLFAATDGISRLEALLKPSSGDERTRACAAMATGMLCACSVELARRVSAGSAFESLLDLMKTHYRESTRAAAAMVFGHLCGHASPDFLRRVADNSHVLATLLALVGDVTHNQFTRGSAALAIGHMCAYSADLAHRVADRGALVALVSFTNATHVEAIRASAALSIGRICCHLSRSDLAVRAIDSGAVAPIVSMLDARHGEHMRRCAAIALGNISSAAAELARAVAESADVGPLLVQLLDASLSEPTRASAATAIRNLCSKSRCQVLVDRLSDGGAIPLLVSILTDVSLGEPTRRTAAYALANMCLVAPVLGPRVLGVGDAVSALADLLGASRDVDTRRAASLLVGNASSSRLEHDVSRGMVECGFVPLIACLMSREHAPATRKFAANAMARLCLTPDLARQASEAPSTVVVAQLADLLDTNCEEGARVAAALALGNMCGHGRRAGYPHDVAHAIAESGAIARLVDLLLVAVADLSRMSAAFALGNVCVTPEISRRFYECGAVDALVALLTGETHSERTRKRAASALSRVCNYASIPMAAFHDVLMSVPTRVERERNVRSRRRNAADSGGSTATN